MIAIYPGSYSYIARVKGLSAPLYPSSLLVRLFILSLIFWLSCNFILDPLITFWTRHQVHTLLLWKWVPLVFRLWSQIFLKRSSLRLSLEGRIISKTMLTSLFSCQGEFNITGRKSRRMITTGAGRLDKALITTCYRTPWRCLWRPVLYRRTKYREQAHHSSD